VSARDRADDGLLAYSWRKRVAISATCSPWKRATFLATVLRTGRSKNAPDFANEGTAEPKSAGLIEKMAHLGAYVSEANWRTENDRVGLGKLIDRGHWHLGKTGPSGLGTVFFEHIVRSELGAPDRGRLLRRGLVWRPRPLLRPMRQTCPYML